MFCSTTALNLIRICFIAAAVFLMTGPCLARSVDLELRMPASVFSPGVPFSLDLVIYNPGPELEDAEIFVALTLGTGDFWMYPTWCHYPSDIDWLTTNIAGDSKETLSILPEFNWPSGAGNFFGAMFVSAILFEGELSSNIATQTFGWSSPVPPGFIYIPPGTFFQGSPFDEPCATNLDTPQHEVNISNGIFMMVTEVTRQMWADLKASEPTLPEDQSPQSLSPTMSHPIQCVSWYDAVLFANLLSKHDGLTPCYYKNKDLTILLDATNYLEGDIYCDFVGSGYRLPTEAEWEYAARAGTTGPFSTEEPFLHGSTGKTCNPKPSLNALNSIAWWCANSDSGSGRMAHPIATKDANPWGLHDMHGNVYEWCWDWFECYSDNPVTNPTGPSEGSHRVIRSGSWSTTAVHCRSANRYELSPSSVGYMMGVGFRLVRTADGWQPPPTPTTSPSAPTVTPTPTVSPTPFTIQFTYLAPGIFEQGSPETEPCRWEDEQQHQTTLTRGFFIMTTEVTRQTWADLKTIRPDLPDDPTWFKNQSSVNHPVQGVSWFETLLFANLLSLKEGLTSCYYIDEGFYSPVDAYNYDTSETFFCNFYADGYRLPTEAEWEYACRAGTSSVFHFEEPDYCTLNCDSCFPDPPLPVLDCFSFWCGNSDDRPQPVASLQPNPWNLFDMHGNVSEWCWDWFENYLPYPVVDPTGSTGSFYRCIRGGSWYTYAGACRSAHRSYAKPDFHNGSVGFRLVRTAL